MTSYFTEKTDTWMNYQIDPECMKNICSVLFEYLEILVNDPNVIKSKPIIEIDKNSPKKPISSKQLCKDNKRATQVLVARGYHGSEIDIQHVLMQARRQRYW